MELRKSFGELVRGAQLQARGWLRKQLELQAKGQAGNLDRIWRDVRDSAWIGGDAEGWERVPYWLDGFIDLAWMLDDDDLKARARRYIDAILAQQKPDGWICPCPDDQRADYDMWALFLLSKVLMVWEHRSGDERVAPALLKAFAQYRGHLQEHPLSRWGKYRWYEGLLAIAWLFEKTGETWLIDLADEIRAQSFDYPGLVAAWPYKGKEKQWTFEAHVVNLGMALHSELAYQRLHPEQAADGSEFAEALYCELMRYHSMACGHFTGDECLSGDSPSQGSELCSVVEAMFSYELLLRQTGQPVWGDRLEQLAFNALPATCSADMWTHQYDQSTNQVACVREPKPLWSTNGPEANWFGLEPNFGCCTANHGQGWPKLAANAMLLGQDGVIVAVPVPAELKTDIGGVAVQVDVESMYPFRNTATIRIVCDKPVTFTLTVRIPGCADSATLDGASVTPGTFVTLRREWSTAELPLQMSFHPRFVERPRDMKALWYGPLLFAVPISYQKIKHEYTRNGVERKAPYCDYELKPLQNLTECGYSFHDNQVNVVETDMLREPFSDVNPPLELRAFLNHEYWPIREGYQGMAADWPQMRDGRGLAEWVRMIPYGCTMLRYTEMPFLPF